MHITDLACRRGAGREGVPPLISDVYMFIVVQAVGSEAHADNSVVHLMTFILL